MIINGFVLEKQSSTKNVLECTPRLYTSEHWGKSFRTVYQLIEHEFETRSSLFWREDKEEHEMLQWVCLVKIALK